MLVWALHTPHEIMEKGIPFLATCGDKEEGEKITEERERKEKEAASHQEESSFASPSMKGLFEELNFDGFDFVYDPNLQRLPISSNSIRWDQDPEDAYLFEDLCIHPLSLHRTLPHHAGVECHALCRCGSERYAAV